MNLAFARKCADRLVARLQPVCERIEIAGSIRRRRPMVTHIDLVIAPKTEPQNDLFGNVIGHTNLAANEVRKIAKELDGITEQCSGYLIAFISGIEIRA